MAESDDSRFVGQALELARRNARSAEGGPFGAVVVCDGRVVGEGRNLVTAELDPTTHAEVVAIRAAGRTLGRFDLSGCVLYASCEPCPMCLAAAYWARIDRLVYTATHEQAAAAGFDDAFLYREIARPPPQRNLKMERIEGPGEDPLALWLANPRRIPY